jgi:predicted secreted protein
MTTSARIGYGAKFQTGNDASPESFTDFLEVTSITPPNMSVDSIDATHMASPSGAREFIAGLLDAGDVGIEFNFVPGNASALALMTELGTVPRPTKTRRIVFPDLSYFQFEAFITGFEPEGPVDDKMGASATFKVTGLPTLTQQS